MTRRLMVNLVTVLLLGIVMVTWVVTQMLGTAIVGAPIRVVADFAASGGVFTNQEVTYRGVLVGRVGELALSEDGVDIELLIDEEWAERIPESVAATVRSKSAVGEQFVNLTPAYETNETLDEGDRIPRERTSLPVDFQELLQSLDRVLVDVEPETARRVVTDLADGIGGHAEEIGTILGSLGTLAEGFASVGPEQQRLLDNATSAGAEFLATKESLTKAIAAADEVFAGIGDEPDELRRLFEANDRFARAGIELLARQGRNLASGIGGLADFMTFQLAERATIEDALTYVPQFLHAIEDASIPWVAPDGRRFYRIRVGLVLDNVRAFWPCKYGGLPQEYERQAHVRMPRQIPTGRPCVKEPADTNTASMDALLDELEGWAERHPAREVPTSRDNLVHGGETQTPAS